MFFTGFLLGFWTLWTHILPILIKRNNVIRKKMEYEHIKKVLKNKKNRYDNLYSDKEYIKVEK